MVRHFRRFGRSYLQKMNVIRALNDGPDPMPAEIAGDTMGYA